MKENYKMRPLTLWCYYVNDKNINQKLVKYQFTTVFLMHFFNGINNIELVNNS